MIEAAVCNSFVNELPQGLHNFQAAGNTFNLALYYDNASLNAGTTIYTTTEEVVGTNYSAGGIALTSVNPTLSGNTSIMDFQDATFTNVTLANVSGGLIYNVTNGNRAVAVLKFNALVSATAQDIDVLFPGASVLTAILRILRNG